MKIILEREKLPNLAYSESNQEKLTLIERESSSGYFKRLLTLEEKYKETKQLKIMKISELYPDWI